MHYIKNGDFDAFSLSDKNGNALTFSEDVIAGMQAYTTCKTKLDEILKTPDDGEFNFSMHSFLSVFVKPLYAFMNNGENNSAYAYITSFKIYLKEVEDKIWEEAVFDGIKDKRFVLKRLKKLNQNFISKVHVANTNDKILDLLYSAPRYKKDVEIEEAIAENNKKLVWKGTVAQFGFIIDLLVQEGYLEKPTSSFEKDAGFYLEHFMIDTKKATLAKELSETTNSLTVSNRNKFSIPNKDKLR